MRRRKSAQNANNVVFKGKLMGNLMGFLSTCIIHLCCLPLLLQVSQPYCIKWEIWRLVFMFSYLSVQAHTKAGLFAIMWTWTTITAIKFFSIYTLYYQLVNSHLPLLLFAAVVVVVVVFLASDKANRSISKLSKIMSIKDQIRRDQQSRRGADYIHYSSHYYNVS